MSIGLKGMGRIQAENPGEMVLFCQVPMEGHYQYDILCKPSDTVGYVKDQLIHPTGRNNPKVPYWTPEPPRPHSHDGHTKFTRETMHLRVGSLGILDDDRTLESYGITCDAIEKHWIEVLEI